MRKSLLLVYILFAFSFWAGAQNMGGTKKGTKKFKHREHTKGTWSKGGLAAFAVAQAGSRNWAGGGDRFTLSANAFLYLYAKHTKGRCHWDNMVDASYGLLKSRSLGLIKNDDKLDITSRWSVDLGSKEVHHIRVGALINMRTQFVDGYDFDNAEKRRISSFLAPGIFTLSPGIEYYNAKGNFTAHLGFASRSVIVSNRPYELAANYGVKPNREVKIEAGGHLAFNCNKEIFKNVNLRSYLDIFSDVIAGNPTNMDIYWTNMLNLRVNNWLSVIYSFDLKYDDDTQIFGYAKNRPDTQLKSLFGVGASVKF